MFVVVYDMRQPGGLYMKAANGDELSGPELETALAVLNATRARDGKAPLDRSYYEGESPQRMYGADIVTLWVNVVEHSENGLITREYRHEVSAAELRS